MREQRGQHRFAVVANPPSAENIATVYDEAGDDYVAYADGDPYNLFAFEGAHAYADRRLWALLETKLNALRTSGASSVNILDAGCGPGTWLRRLVTRARQIGFSRITARGFDVAQAQIRAARRKAHDLSGLPGVNLTFDVADLTGALPEADASVDMTLCLYSVLSHLPVASLPKVSVEIARVTRGHFITTVRSIGSTPTAFVDSIEKARHFSLDHRLDLCEVELRGGRRLALPFHLFSARELRNGFSDHFTSTICAASTYSTIDSSRITAGIRRPFCLISLWRTTSRGWRKPGRGIPLSWNAQPICCSWGAAARPRNKSVDLCDPIHRRRHIAPDPPA